MKTKVTYFVNFATCSDGIMRDCRIFDRLSDAKAFASTLLFKWEIERRTDAGFAFLSCKVIARSADPSARYQDMARKAAERVARYYA